MLLFTATFGQIIIFLFKSHHFRTYFLYMIRYNNISRPVHDPPATPRHSCPKSVGSRPPNPQDWHPCLSVHGLQVTNNAATWFLEFRSLRSTKILMNNEQPLFIRKWQRWKNCKIRVRIRQWWSRRRLWWRRRRQILWSQRRRDIPPATDLYSALIATVVEVEEDWATWRDEIFLRLFL